MKLALVMVLVATVPMFVTGVGAVNIATEKAEESASLILEREAVAQAEFVGRWTNDQLQALIGWMQPFPLGNNATGKANQSVARFGLRSFRCRHYAG